MRRSWVGAIGTVLVLAALPAAAAAQQTRTCRQTRPSDFQRIVNAWGQELLYFKDPVRWVCTGGILLEADSAVMNRAVSTIELVGGVVYRDTARELTADWANYMGKDDQLYARGNVVLRELDTQARITGETLDYRRATPERPESRMIVQGGRPHAVLPPRPDSAAATPPDTAQPLEVWGRVIEIDNENIFRARGDVELLRGDMRGAGQSLRYSDAEEHLTLRGKAHVESDAYRLEGERIDAQLQGDTLREVRADSAARLVSEDLTILSQQLRIGFIGGDIDRLEAWTPGDRVSSTSRTAPAEPGRASPRPAPVPPAPGASGSAASPASPPPGMALAIAKDFRLSADSIDARADSGAVREVRAVGRARGERKPDSTGARVPGIVARDWVQGDTIIGYFDQRPTAARPADTSARRRSALERGGLDSMKTVPEGDVAADDLRRRGSERADPDSLETVLERIVVIGTAAPALSLYRLEPEHPGGPRPVNFMRAKKIELFLTHGDVERVEAEGPIEGRYLEPVPPKPAAADTTSAPVGRP